MKTFATAAFFATTAVAAQAGTYSEPVMEPVVIVEEAAASSAPSAMMVLVLTTLIVMGTAAGQ